MDDVSGVGASQMDEAVPVERFLAPASAAQARIALVEQIEACAGAFNLAVMLTVRGPVRPDLLRDAFDGLIDRHEILRTNIVRNRNEFLQAIRISGSEPPPFETTLVEATAEQIKSDFLIRARRPFDLAQDWLIQASWRPEADGVGHLLIVLHHVLADAMSLPVLLRDFMALYQAASLGQASPLPELALHHADYAHWERGERSSSTEDDLEYWRLTLTDSPGAIALPSRPRPRRQSFTGEMLERALPAGCSAAVAALARGCGATPAAVYLAAFAMALRSRASQTDLPLGVPYSARDRAEISDLVGPLLNVLVLRLRLEPEMTFRELVVHASQVMREGQGRQAARFEEIVDRIGGSRDLGRPPLFNVMYAYEHGSQDEFRVGDAHFQIDRLFNGGAKYDLTIYVTDELAGGRFALEWASLLFDADDIARFADGFVAGLQAGLEAPASRLDALPTVGEGEQAEIDAICVGKPAPACAALAEQLLSGLRRRPDADALTCGAETWTFGQLEDRIAAIAAGLAQAVDPGRDRVAIFSRPTMEAVASILASLLAGVAYVPVDPDMPPGRIQAILEDADCRLLLLSEADRDRAPASIEQRLFSNTGEGAQLFEEFRDDTATAYLIYTSGSTGTPKGVVVSRANLAAFLAAMDTTVPISDDSVWLASTTISFDIAVLELIWTLSRGVHVVLADSELFVERPARRGPVVQPALSLFFFGAFEDRPQRGRYGPLLEAARLADEAGLSAVWLPERHFDPFGGAFPSPAVLGAAVGAVTSKISIRAGSVVLPLHDPIRVAEDWAVIDQLTAGRAGLSLASGWHAQDFVLEPDAYVQRRFVLRERLEIIRRLWRGERICRPGPDRTSFDIEIFPKPLKGGIPVWLTSSGAQETFQEAGQLGLGLLTHLLGQSIDDLEDKLRLYRAARSNAGEEDRGSAAVMLHTYLAADGAEARARATAPLRRYLRSSLPLLGSLLRGLGHDQDLGQIGGDRLDAIVNMAADRFLSVNGMIGSPREAARMVGGLSEIGVDEVACFIDFGIDSGAVLDSVRRIAELRSSLGAGGAETISRCAFAELVERHDVTHFQATPSLLRLLLRAAGGKRALSRLQTLLVGGEALDAATAEALRSAVKGHLLNMYGPTEATVWCCSHPVEAGEGPPPIGTPVPGMAVAVLDAWRQQTPIGALGELRIVGPQVAQGYHLRPEASALSLFRRADDGRVSYDSGDLVSLRTGDGLIFHGRADRQIKIAGHRLELGEIDAHLKRQPGIADAACVAIPTKTGGTRLVAFFAPEGGCGQLPRDVAADHPLFAGRFTTRLADGLRVAGHDAAQTAVLAYEIFGEDVYLQAGILLPEVPVVVDVGANIGLFTLRVLDARPRARVVAIEPIPETFTILQANASVYGPGVSCHGLGLGAAAGEARFRYYPRASALSSSALATAESRIRTRDVALAWLRATGGGERIGDDDIERVVEQLLTAHEIDVPIIALSDLLAREGLEHVDLLKIDTEGSELEVLEGLREDDWHRVRQIVVEAETTAEAEGLEAKLTGMGMEVVRRPHMHFRRSDGSEDSTFVLIARRRDTAAPTGAACGRPDERQLRDALSRDLGQHASPSQFVLINRIPLTPNGKIDHVALMTAAADLGQTDEVRLQRFEGGTQALLAQHWARILGHAQFGPEDDFFATGGTSIRLLELFDALEADFPGVLSLADLIELTTIQRLAAALERPAKSDETAGPTVFRF